MRTTDEITIQAPIEEVWALTTAVEGWPAFTPTVRRVERLDTGPLAVGSRVRLAQPAQRAATWVVTELDPPHRFAWETRRGRLRIVAAHELRAQGGHVVNRLTLDLSGPGARVVGRLLGPVLRRALRTENAGFKARAEAAAAPPPAPGPTTAT